MDGSVDDELGTFETLGKNAVSETTSECSRERIWVLEQDRISADGRGKMYTGMLRCHNKLKI